MAQEQWHDSYLRALGYLVRTSAGSVAHLLLLVNAGELVQNSFACRLPTVHGDVCSTLRARATKELGIEDSEYHP